MLDGWIERMAMQVAEWDASGDGRAVFLDCYTEMTRSVGMAIDAGRFADPAWVERLLDRFAHYYFVSVDGGEAGGVIPEPWVLAHAAAVGYDASALQLLLAGVSAHINYDLVLTLVDVLDDEWGSLGEPGRERRRADYDEINRVIADTADRVQDLVLERRAPELSAFDPALGRWDERLAVKLLTGWRSRVWRHACDLLDVPDPDVRAQRIVAVERQCVRRARWILI